MTSRKRGRGRVTKNTGRAGTKAVGPSQTASQAPASRGTGAKRAGASRAGAKAAGPGRAATKSAGNSRAGTRSSGSSQTDGYYAEAIRALVTRDDAGQSNAVPGRAETSNATPSNGSKSSKTPQRRRRMAKRLIQNVHRQVQQEQHQQRNHNAPDGSSSSSDDNDDPAGGDAEHGAGSGGELDDTDTSGDGPDPDPSSSDGGSEGEYDTDTSGDGPDPDPPSSEDGNGGNEGPGRRGPRPGRGLTNVKAVPIPHGGGKLHRIRRVPGKTVNIPGSSFLVLNGRRTTQGSVYVFGEGSMNELGLGCVRYNGLWPRNVKRPRINHLLPDRNSEGNGIVEVACGGSHTLALTAKGEIWSWGVNDDSALGRVTPPDIPEGLINSPNFAQLNLAESTPGEIQDYNDIVPGTDAVVSIAATDSASFALTAQGFVLGWGTFRGSDGIIGFSQDRGDLPQQWSPKLIEDLQDIVKIACGSNHVLALDTYGSVWAWGSGGQYQLGRKAVTRGLGTLAALRPQKCAMFSQRPGHHATDIGVGAYHSFYVDDLGRTWSWGLNNYAQTGQPLNAGEDDAMVLPQIVESLKDYKIRSITGGLHHSVACTEDGQLLTWGRIDGHQVGHANHVFTEDNTIFDEQGRPRILFKPTAVQGVDDIHKVYAGTDTSLAITKDGRVYSWGFSANYQTGQNTLDDVETPTLVNNTALQNTHITMAGMGSQFGVLLGYPRQSPPTPDPDEITSLISTQ
ncbi:putative regulator of chromosome condensation protein [Xylariaceae sp. FL0016]|nr:putative regulator of chromosome condensation protein [Xylariaceae sp. FL0016]